MFSLNSWIAIIIKNMLSGTALSNATSGGGGGAGAPGTNLAATLYSAVPYVGAALAMWAVAWCSARFDEKDLHTGLPWVAGGVCLTFFAPLYSKSFGAGFAVIVAALTCAYSSQSVIFARVTESLDTRHAGVGVSIFNAVGAAIGGFVGPYSVGAFVQRTGSIASSMVFMGVFLMSAGAMMVGLGAWECARRRRGAGPVIQRVKSAAPPKGKEPAPKVARLIGKRPAAEV